MQTFNRPDIMIIITSSLNEQQRLKISRGLPAAFHRRRAYLRLQMQASATHASSYNVGVCECVWSLCECVYLYYRLVQASVTYASSYNLGFCECVFLLLSQILLQLTSASQCDVCRLRCVSLCALLVGVTHTISVIHIVVSRKSLCVA